MKTPAGGAPSRVARLGQPRWRSMPIKSASGQPSCLLSWNRSASTKTSSDPGEPSRNLTGRWNSRSRSDFKLTARSLMSCQKKHRLISMLMWMGL